VISKSSVRRASPHSAGGEVGEVEVAGDDRVLDVVDGIRDVIG
jgi:hypothetical protein